MNTDHIAAAIRMMIDAAVRNHAATLTGDVEEKRIAGELYTVNEIVMREGLQKLADIASFAAKNSQIPPSGLMRFGGR